MGDQVVQLALNPWVTEHSKDVFAMVEVDIEVGSDDLVAPAEC